MRKFRFVLLLTGGLLLAGCENDPGGPGGGGGRPAQSDFYGTWSTEHGYTLTRSANEWSLTSTDTTVTYSITSWEAAENTDEATKGTYPYGFNICSTLNVDPYTALNYNVFINSAKTSYVTVSNIGATVYTKQ